MRRAACKPNRPPPPPPPAPGRRRSPLSPSIRPPLRRKVNARDGVRAGAEVFFRHGVSFPPPRGIGGVKGARLLRVKRATLSTKEKPTVSVSYDPFSAHWTFPFEKLPSTGRTWRHGGCILRRGAAKGGAPTPAATSSGGRGPPSWRSRTARHPRRAPVYRRRQGKLRHRRAVGRARHLRRALRRDQAGHALGKDGKKLTNGSQVFQGDPIAVVGLVGTPQMLHFEVYWNDVDGELSNPWNRGSKAKYRFVKARDYDAARTCSTRPCSSTAWPTVPACDVKGSGEAAGRSPRGQCGKESGVSGVPLVADG